MIEGERHDRIRAALQRGFTRRRIDALRPLMRSIAGRLVDDCASATSAGLVAAALADFDDHWRYGLKRIVTNLDDCHAALHDAAAAYQQVEQAIARAAAGD